MSELLAQYIGRPELTFIATDEFPEGSHDTLSDLLREAGRISEDRIARDVPPGSIVDRVMDRIQGEEPATGRTFSRGYPRYAAGQAFLDQLAAADPNNDVYAGSNMTQRILLQGDSDSNAVESVNTFTSFSGADMTIYIGGEVIGEVQSYEMNERMDNGSIEGWIELVRFDRDSALYRIARTQSMVTMRIRQANEYGQGATRDVSGIRFQRRVIQMSIDNATEVERYYFTAQGITVIPEEA